MSDAEMVPVMDEDRELAAKFYASQRYADEIQHGLILNGQADDLATVQLISRHRLAAEAAALEKAAGYVEGAGGVIPGATVFAPLVSGNNMPCMSGDARDRLHPNKRRYFDDATKTLATAIRSLKEGASHVGEARS